VRHHGPIDIGGLFGGHYIGLARQVCGIFLGLSLRHGRLVSMGAVL